MMVSCTVNLESMDTTNLWYIHPLTCAVMHGLPCSPVYVVMLLFKVYTLFMVWRWSGVSSSNEPNMAYGFVGSF